MKTLIDRAKEFATEKHKGQVRKYSGEPYINHCEEVAIIVNQTPRSTIEMVAAAYLHDTVEDTDTTIVELLHNFGPTVASLVSMVTDVRKPSDGNRAIRKALDRYHIAHATPQAKTIKLADLISNSKSILESEDPEAIAFAKTYIAEKKLLLEVLREGDSTLYQRAMEMVEKYNGRV